MAAVAQTLPFPDKLAKDRSEPEPPFALLDGGHWQQRSALGDFKMIARAWYRAVAEAAWVK